MFTRNIFLTFSTEIACVGINFLVGVLLARALSPNDRGIMSLVMTFPLIIFNLTNLGLHESTVFFVGRKKLAPGQVLGNSLVIGSIISLVVVILLVAFGQLLQNSFLKGLPTPYYLPLIFLVPVGLMQGIFLSVLRAKEQFPLLNALRFFSAILLFVALIVVLLWLNTGLGGAVWAFIMTSILILGFVIIAVARSVRSSFEIKKDLVKNILRYGFKSYLQVIFESLNYRLDLFLIAWFLVPEQVAYYGLATSLAELAWYLPNSVGSVLFARLSNMPLDEVHLVTGQACRITLALTGVLVLMLASVVWFFVPWVYGEMYQPAVPCLLILLPGILAAAVHKVLNRNFASRDRQQFTIISSLAALLVIISLDVWLIPAWGINGAAFASSLGYIIAGGLLLIFFVRDSKLSTASILFVQRSELNQYLRNVINFIRTGKNTSQL